MTEARRQALRLRRFGLAAATYAIWAAFMVYADNVGLYRLELGGLEIPVWWMVAAMLAGNAVWFTMFVSGANLRFDDPSLTFPMMLYALMLAVLTAGALPEARAMSFSAFIVVFMFGIFNLRASKYAACWVIAMAGYVLVAWETTPPDATESRVNAEILQGVLLAALLFWVSYFGHYVGRLRDKLNARNEELKQALALVEELAIRDDLTGLHNRRFVMDALDRERQRAARHEVPFSVLVLDIDHFKAINDRYGHAIGDEVLKGFVARLAKAVRGADFLGSAADSTDSDTIGRFGGEEFIVVLPHTDLSGARRLAERILSETARAALQTSSGPVSITVSIGVTEYRAGETVRELLERVDGAMYAAKRAGRDRIGAAPPDADATPHVYSAVEAI